MGLGRNLERHCVLMHRIKIMLSQFILWSCLFLFSLQFCGITSAQSYRELGTISLNESFENMLKYSKHKDFEKLSSSLQLIKPLSQSLDAKYSKDNEKAILSAIENKDGEKVLQAVQQLIFLDMEDQLLIGITIVPNSKDTAITKFKNAYMDYLFLSPYIQENDYSGDQKIKNLFRKFVLSINKYEELAGVNQEIKKEILKSFPNFN
jgi:hypothetical protein